MNDAHTLPEFRRLLADIQAGQCALILGPEIFAIDGEPLQRLVRRRIMERFGDQIASYYERDGFFIVKNQDDKPEIAEAVADLLRDLRPSESSSLGGVAN